MKNCKEVQAAANRLGLQLHILKASTDSQIGAAFAGLAKLKAGVLLIGSDSYFNSKSRLLAELSLRYAVPAIFEFGEFVGAGGLMSYSDNIKESYRWAGLYTGRIVRRRFRSWRKSTPHSKAHPLINPLNLA